MIPTFRNLKFRPHRTTVKAIAASLEVNPNVYISVVAGPGFYSTPGGVTANLDDFDDYPDSNEFSSFEVAVIDENLSEDEQKWDVNGWQSRQDINQLIANTINK